MVISFRYKYTVIMNINYKVQFYYKPCAELQGDLGNL